jgi:methionyl-tRNA formyltransferase
VIALEEGMGLVVATGGGALLVREAQLEGKRPSRGRALIQQLRGKVGDRFGGGPEEGNY